VSQVRVETPGEWLAEHELFVEYLPVVGLGRPKKDAEIPADLREFRSTSTTRSAPRASPLNPAWGRQA
jgi:hypothetical protein